MARTIDNLGADISTRYAEDQELFDETYIKEAGVIPSQTRISVTLPSYPSEFDALFHLEQRRALWAAFYAPPNYYAYRRRLFAEQIIPSIGTPDKQEMQISRIEVIGKEEEDPQMNQEIESERQALLKLLQNLHTLDRLIIDINSRRAQYQKG